MPDTNNPSDLTPVTDSKAAQDELDREIAAAKALPVSSTAYEARLVSAPIPPPAGPATQGQSPVQSILQNTDGTAPVINPDAVSPNPTGARSIAPLAPAFTPAPASANLPASDATQNLDASAVPASPLTVENAGPPVSPADPAVIFPSLPTTAGLVDGSAGAANGGDADLSVFDRAAVTAATGQAQSFQQSADRLRGALEQNTGLANSLFNQMLDLIDSQNRQLGEVDRRMSDLGGQLKSLKNP